MMMVWMAVRGKPERAPAGGPRAPRNGGGPWSMKTHAIPSVSLKFARTGNSTRANEFGMRVMQERA